MKLFTKILKDLVYFRPQAILFIFCILFSIGTYISVDSLEQNVEVFVERDSKIIFGGDLEFEASRAFSENVTNYFEELKLDPDITISETLEFSSVVYNPAADNSLLSQIRIVDDNYPLYGEVILEDNSSGFGEVLRADYIVVERDLLLFLNMSVGDELVIGNHSFVIANVLVSEPDVALNLFRIGPKVLIHSDNLEDLGLVGEKSRVEYENLIKTNSDERSLQILSDLEVIKGEREEVAIYNDSDSNLTEFVFNFLFFIKLISIFIIFIIGIGLGSIVRSLLIDMKNNIAIRKFIGERSSSLLKYYFSMILFLTLVGFILSVLFSYVLSFIFPFVFAQVLPSDVVISISLISIAKGLIIAILISLLFTFIPIYNLKFVRPNDMLRKTDRNEIPKKIFYGAYFVIFIFFASFVFLELADLKFSLYIVLGSLGFFIVLYIINYLLLKLTSYFSKRKFSSLALKLAVKGMFRIGNKTMLIILTLTLSLTLIFSLTFVERNLQNQFVTTFPPDAPNMFLVDIPKDKRSDIESLLGIDNLEFYPVIRGGVESINGESIESIEKRVGRGEPVTRLFSLTYNDGSLRETENLIDSLERGNVFISDYDDSQYVQVSVLDLIAERMELELGDKMVFLVQGVEINAEVVSFREREVEGIGVFFYFTFEEYVLEDAPQTIFTTLRVPAEELGEIQNKVIKEFPQITVINAERTAKTVASIIGKLSSVVSFFTLFSLIGGVLILISSIYATNLERVKESVFYKLVGSNRSLVRKVFVLEYVIIGLISSLSAVVFAMIAAFAISEFIFEITFDLLLFEAVLFVVLTILVVVLLGYFSVREAVHKRPIEYVRENNVE